ncbi:hypothetical protein ZWY2020_051155 [Hordeum vulgare]|nr:hypothetical protein ZWY2020_051155 [Hordeum vulgare]
MARRSSQDPSPALQRLENILQVQYRTLVRHDRNYPDIQDAGSHFLFPIHGTFKLALQFTEDYPNKPPTVRFVSRMFHPNIYADGSICLDILQNQWIPIYDVAAILTSIQVFFRPSLTVIRLIC